MPIRLKSCESIYSKINDKILKLKNIGILHDKYSSGFESGFKFKNDKLKSNIPRPRGVGNYYLDFDDENSENEEEQIMPTTVDPRKQAADLDAMNSGKHYDFDETEIREWIRKQEKSSTYSKSYRVWRLFLCVKNNFSNQRLQLDPDESAR